MNWTNLKVGDLITTYNKGFFILDSIEKRYVTKDMQRYTPYEGIDIGDEIVPLFHYTQRYTADGDPRKGKSNSCDASFCNLAYNELELVIRDKEKVISKLKELQNKILK